VEYVQCNHYLFHRFVQVGDCKTPTESPSEASLLDASVLELITETTPPGRHTLYCSDKISPFSELFFLAYSIRHSSMSEPVTLLPDSHSFSLWQRSQEPQPTSRMFIPSSRPNAFKKLFPVFISKPYTAGHVQHFCSLNIR